MAATVALAPGAAARAETKARSLRRALALVSLPVIGIVMWIGYGRGVVSNDGVWYLVRGQELLGMATVDPSVAATSTPHPISTLIAAAALIVDGAAAPTLLLVLVYALTALTFWLIARTVFLGARTRPEVAPALAAAAFAGVVFATRPITAVVASNASLDAALALALVAFTWGAIQGKAFGPVAGLSLLAAGLLKPETWPLAAVLAAYVLATSPKRSGWMVLAALAPVLWALFDWATTGDPMAAFNTTAAVENDIRAREIVTQDTFFENLTAAPIELVRAMGPLVAIVLTVLVPLGANRLRREERKVLLIVVGVGCAFLLGLTVEALSGKRMVTRYTLPLLALAMIALGVLLNAALRRVTRARGFAFAGAILAVVVAKEAVPLADIRSQSGDRVSRFEASRAALKQVRCSTLLVPSSILAPYAVLARPDLRVMQVRDPVPAGAYDGVSTITAGPEAGRDIVWAKAFRPVAFGSQASAVTYRGGGWTVRDGCTAA